MPLIEIERIFTSHHKWKREVRPESVSALSESIREFGQLQPILVRMCLDQPEGKYELLAGEHRLEAAKDAGIEKIEAKILDVDDIDAFLVSVEENVRRYAPETAELDEAMAEWKEMHELKHGKTERGGDRGNQYVGGRESGKSAARRFATEAAEKLGVHERTVEKSVARAKKLSPNAKKAMADKKISAGQADELVKLPKGEQDELLPEVLGLGVKETRELVRVRKTVKHDDIDAGPPESEGSDLDQALAKVKRLSSSACDAWVSGEISDSQADELAALAKGRQDTRLSDLKEFSKTAEFSSPELEQVDEMLKRLARLINESISPAERLNDRLSRIADIVEDKGVSEVSGFGALRIMSLLKGLRANLARFEKLFEF